MILLGTICWFSLAAVIYAYIGYPLLLYILTAIVPNRNTDSGPSFEQTVSLIIPAHNEGEILEKKIGNTLELQFPEEKLEILIISDGSTDDTRDIAQQYAERIMFYELKQRKGKAAALNLGLQRAAHDIIVFSDASIMLKADALQNLVSRFKAPHIGCVSGEDYIEGSSGEGLYGRYELFLRNLESKLYSIVGASGSFYAQRKALCRPFEEGLAPDFLSVLNTVEQGYVAVTEPSAVGTMSAVKETKDEFARKVRTLVRGMTALFKKAGLLNPFKHPLFALTLGSHKVVRWLVPFFLSLLLISTLFLAGHPFYLLLFTLQAIFYSLGICSMFKVKFLQESILGKIPQYFLLVNLAILVAWWKYLRGMRQEIWIPSKR